MLLRTDNGSEISFSVKNKLEAVMEASEKITGFCRENGIDNKKAMRISLAIEEILQVIIVKCIPDDKEQFIDIRICRFDNNVIMRIRNNGKIFDPVSYYEQNKNDEKMEEELMGLKMIIKATENVDFRRTFGTNNLTITF